MTTTGSIHPDFVRWAAAEAERAATRRAEDPVDRAGPPSDPSRAEQPDTAWDDNKLVVNPKDLSRLANVTAKMASGFFRPTKRTEVVWTEGDSELLVSIDGVETEIGDGLVAVTIPVTCDETGQTKVTVPFAVGRDGFPAGTYASTFRRPIGPELIVDVWGDALVAFGWQILLTLFIQVAGVAGKDERGNRLVPGSVVATSDGLAVRPMERHRFFGSTGLLDRRGARS